METNTLVKEVIRISYEVHHELGCGFSESVYENALMIALFEAGISAESQFPLKVQFREKIVGEFYVDILVEKVLLLELKAVSKIDGVHKSQLLNYLKASNQKTGLLLNFGTMKLDVNRLYNNHCS